MKILGKDPLSVMTVMYVLRESIEKMFPLYLRPLQLITEQNSTSSVTLKSMGFLCILHILIHLGNELKMKGTTVFSDVLYLREHPLIDILLSRFSNILTA